MRAHTRARTHTHITQLRLEGSTYCTAGNVPCCLLTSITHTTHHTEAETANRRARTHAQNKHQRTGLPEHTLREVAPPNVRHAPLHGHWQQKAEERRRQVERSLRRGVGMKCGCLDVNASGGGGMSYMASFVSHLRVHPQAEHYLPCGAACSRVGPSHVRLTRTGAHRPIHPQQVPPHYQPPHPPQPPLEHSSLHNSHAHTHIHQRTQRLTCAL
jgi:hypothetical protein